MFFPWEIKVNTQYDFLFFESTNIIHVKVV